MTPQTFLLPVFVQVALTFGLHFWMAYMRVGALQRGEVREKDVTLRQPNWPKRVTQIANSYHSQLELPLLFYLLMLGALITSTADNLLLILAWAFVLSRIVHAAIHTTVNTQPWRFLAYGAGMAILVAMWIVFAIRVLAGPAVA